jgi:hypothetical protein
LCHPTWEGWHNPKTQSSGEFLEGDMIALQQFGHRIPKQIRVRPVVEPEGDFAQVSRKMLGTDLVVGAKLLALFEVLTKLEETSGIGKIADEIHEIETSLVERLDGEDARRFRDVIKQKLWGERTEHFKNAFCVTVSNP